MPEPEYVPFDMACEKCEYEPVCKLPLIVTHKLTRSWFRFLKEYDLTKRDGYCQQGRKRPVHMRRITPDQVTIAQAGARAHLFPKVTI